MGLQSIINFYFQERRWKLGTASEIGCNHLIMCYTVYMQIKGCSSAQQAESELWLRLQRTSMFSDNDSIVGMGKHKDEEFSPRLVKLKRFTFLLN